MIPIKLDKNTHFIIYGAGEVGNNCYRALCKSGFKVAYGLDKSAFGEDPIKGIITYRLGEEPEKDRCNKVVIICLANGLIHPEVARIVYDAGYRYIVFLPMGICIRDDVKCRLTRDYNYVLNGSIIEKRIMVSDFSSYLYPDVDPASSIVRKYDDEYIVWCGLEILHTESIELWTGDRSKIFTKNEYKDRNISVDPPIMHLFNYFAGLKDTPDDYYNSKKKAPSLEEREHDLIARWRLYDLFEREHNKGMDFFIEGAPRAIWNPNNYFNLVGGHHRTIYLLHKGHTLFPIRISDRDFDSWVNYRQFEEMISYLRRNDISSLYAPLPHPGFINYHSKFEHFGRLALSSLLNELYRRFSNGVKGLRVLDTLDDEGYFARMLDREGAENASFFSDNDSQRELAEIINRLLYRNVRIADYISDYPYDVIICKVDEIEKYRELFDGIIMAERVSDICGRTLVEEV